MNKNKLLISSLLLLSLLTSCGGQAMKRYDVSDYSLTLPYVNRFLICQLSDLHFGTATNLEEEFKYLDKVIYSYADILNEPHNLHTPNLIVLDGDTFMNANRYIVDQTFNYFDSLKIPYAFTYGNHDYQGVYTTNYIDSKLKASEYALFKNPKDDDVYGNANYVINLMLGDELKFQIYIMDSNSYVIGEYDNIHQDQVDWYERCVLASAGLKQKPSVITKDTFIKNLTFFHIPTTEFVKAAQDFKAKNGENSKTETDFCYMGKPAGCEGKESQIMNKMHELKATVGVGCAHDHYNAMDINYSNGTDWPIRLIYGNKTGNNCGTDVNNMGATFYSLLENVEHQPSGDKYFELTKILFNYEGKAEVQWKN